MDYEVKNKFVEEYIDIVIKKLEEHNIKSSMEQRKYVLDLFHNSDKTIEEIKDSIDKLVKEFIDNYKKRQEMLLKAKDEKEEPFKWSSPSERKKYELIKAKNQIKQVNDNLGNTNSLNNDNNKKRVLVQNNSNNSGIVSSLLLTLLVGFAGGVVATLMYVFIK